MNNIKYKYRYNDNEFYLIEKFEFDKNFKFPLFDAPILKDDLLDYPLTCLKIESKDKEKILKLKNKWLEKKEENYIKEYEYMEYTYIIFLDSSKKIINKENLAIFPNGLRDYCELGCLNLDKTLIDEILELDQNLQSCVSIELMLELMEENEDMNKYIPLIEKNIENNHLDQCFFFDEYVYELFSKVYVEVLNDYRVDIEDIYE